MLAGGDSSVGVDVHDNALGVIGPLVEQPEVRPETCRLGAGHGDRNDLTDCDVRLVEIELGLHVRGQRLGDDMDTVAALAREGVLRDATQIRIVVDRPQPCTVAVPDVMLQNLEPERRVGVARIQLGALTSSSADPTPAPQ